MFQSSEGYGQVAYDNIRRAEGTSWEARDWPNGAPVPTGAHNVPLVLAATPKDQGQPTSRPYRNPPRSSCSSRLQDDTTTPIPLPTDLSIKLTTDLFDPPALYDDAIAEIHATLTAPNQLPREHWNQLAAILTRGTHAVTFSRLMLLRDWPVFQAAWHQFQHDVLEHHDPPPTTTTTTTTSPWRVTRPPSRLRTAASNTWRSLSGKEPPAADNPSSSSSDLGLPNARLLPHLLLPALHPPQPTEPTEPADTTGANPVDAATLARWIGTGTGTGTGAEPIRGHWRRGTGQQPRRECTVEDYYARFVVVCLGGLYGSLPSAGGDVEGDGEKGAEAWREKLGWLRGEGGGGRERGVVEGVGEQVWILFHMLYFLHCAFREEVLDEEGGRFRRVFGGLFCGRKEEATGK